MKWLFLIDICCYKVCTKNNCYNSIMKLLHNVVFATHIQITSRALQNGEEENLHHTGNQ